MSSTTISRSGNPKYRLPTYLGVGAAALVGYYFYTAGGDPQLARKELKHDAARASAALKDELPGRGKEAKTSAEEAFARVGSEVDSTVREGKTRIADGQRAFEHTGGAIMDKIDHADRKVEDEAARAKRSVGGWFSAKK
ncbi:hypothetical protein Q9L58_009475 [Maublancomyces gigas]|uniref:Calcofluor white hypersensitive protein n=1 Tax=Discina gigas TaxID=1032678 RepID=A0ABR3G6S8_9PEZI